MRTLSQDTKQSITAFVNRYFLNYGYSPTIPVIADTLSLAVGTVHKYLHRMNEAGELSFDGRHIITGEIEQLTGQYAAPVVGSVTCGAPRYAQEEYGERIQLPESVFGKGDFFILRADGESMCNLDVHTGDYIVFRREAAAEDGQHTVVLIGEEATFKTVRFDRKKKKVILTAENDDKETYPDRVFDPEEVRIQGIYTGVIKKAK